jgi:hypothetical protein
MATPSQQFTFQLMSDLHLEMILDPRYDSEAELERLAAITSKSPNLALLGDIGLATGEANKKQLAGFLRRQLRNFRNVYYVPGNHEAYGSNGWEHTIMELRHMAEDLEDECDVERQTAARANKLIPSFGKLYIMNQSAVSLDGVRILGCPLFSNVSKCQRAMVFAQLGDFGQPGQEEWDVSAHNAAHARDVAWLNDQVAQANDDSSVRAIVIFTHWKPSTDPRTTEPRFRKDNEVGSAFQTDLSGEPCWNASKLAVWACGHTHFKFDVSLERTGQRPVRCVANQKGYAHRLAARQYDENKVVVV